MSFWSCAAPRTSLAGLWPRPTVYGPRPAKEVLGAAQDQNDTAEGAIILHFAIMTELVRVGHCIAANPWEVSEVCQLQLTYLL